ncbi:methyl-accepting chemotaxis protein [Asticcacaulis endophyticus]|uniref:Methyl-accepting chemotaxis protein n=1 Tax=Asticcacaulis endophyticus TaxID=1395890 RepID=A0A918Q5K5_9CAUL|nr:methyl-accepting chemotaxis protein [Asticcacaulis endophyticus]GGZ32781.1 methyl-accepting chemotaxis protein [Asticcacaulis endophyticus]
MRFKDLNISLKIISVLALLTLTTMGALGYFAVTFRSVNSTYSDLTTADYPALVALSRVSQRNAFIAQNLYKLSLLQCPSEACKAPEEAVRTSVVESEQLIDKATKALPEHGDTLKELGIARSEVARGAESSLAFLTSGNVSSGLAELAKLEASQLKFRQIIRPLLDKVEANANETTLAVTAKANQTLTWGLTLVGLIVLGVVGLALWMARSMIARPIMDVVSHMDRMSKGELNDTIADDGRKDEIGQMNKALTLFQTGLRETETLRFQAAKQKEQIERERRAGMLELADSFEQSVGGIVALVASAATEMQAAATQLTSTAQETSAQSIAVSAAAEEAGTNVTSVASAAEQLGASVSEIGRQVDTSAVSSANAVREADAAVKIVSDLKDVATSIGGVVDIIAGLAGQTNLLALNATIESARAGEAGRGFAVVASEVKALAGQTAKATDEISAKIAQIQDATGNAASVIQSITGTIQNLNTTNAAIASAVEQQSGATHEIIQAVNQASLGTQEVTINISGVAQAAEQTGEAASQVLSASSELSLQAERLRHEMDRFLANVRAA